MPLLICQCVVQCFVSGHEYSMGACGNFGRSPLCGTSTAMVSVLISIRKLAQNVDRCRPKDGFDHFSQLTLSLKFSHRCCQPQQVGSRSILLLPGSPTVRFSLLMQPREFANRATDHAAK